MAIHIRRRQFLSTLGGSVVAWPLAAPAQQSGKLRRIGFLSAVSRELSSHAALQQRMRELGYVEGKDFADLLGVTIPPQLYIFADEIIE